MNCLLVSYGTLETNSTVQAVGFARGLDASGWSACVAAVSADPQSDAFDFFQCPAAGPLVRQAAPEPADVVHLWTPRAPVWRFLERHARLLRGAVVLHLEDDEDEILAAHGATAAAGAIGRSELRRRRLEGWSHPVLSRALIEAVDGVTVLSPELADWVPAGKAALQLFPPLDAGWAEPPPPQAANLAGVPGPTVVFAGSLHAATEPDFLELCRAMRLLAAAGRELTLVRCGAPATPEVLARAAAIAPRLRDLGFVSEERLRALLRGAAVLVQPGGPTRFNRRRLPAKLLSYLASGTPTILPACYEWLGFRAGEHVVTTQTGSAEELAGAIDSVLAAPAPAREAAARAAALARERFSTAATCGPLDAFYRKLGRRSRTDWPLVRKPRIELPLVTAATRGTPEPMRAAFLHVALEETRHPPRDFRAPPAIAQVFWPSLAGFDEGNSTARPYLASRWQRLVFGPGAVPAGLRPRLDPANRPGVVEIGAVVYRAIDRTVIEHLRPRDPAGGDFAPSGTIRPLAGSARLWRWLSTGDDPQLLLPAARAPGVALIECWLRWTPLE